MGYDFIVEIDLFSGRLAEPPNWDGRRFTMGINVMECGVSCDCTGLVHVSAKTVVKRDTGLVFDSLTELTEICTYQISGCCYHLPARQLVHTRIFTVLDVEVLN